MKEDKDSFPQKIIHYGWCYPWVALGLIILGVASLIFIEGSRSFFAVTILAALNGGILYYKSTKHIPFEFLPTFFLSVSITNALSISWGLYFIVLALVIPSFLSGAIDPISFVWWGNIIFLNFVSLIFGGLPILVLGLIISLLEFISGFFINMFFNPNIAEFLPFSLFSAAVNILYFVALGSLIQSLLQVFS